jgi:hypothetical protein
MTGDLAPVMRVRTNEQSPVFHIVTSALAQGLHNIRTQEAA